MDNLVDNGVRELGGGEANLAVRNVIYLIETLEEGEAIDEVKALAAVAAEVSNDRVYSTILAANGRVQLQGRSANVRERSQNSREEGPRRLQNGARSGR